MSPGSLIVTAWSGPDGRPRGELVVTAQSRYVERVWLPVLGPTATLALRLLGELAASRGGRAELELATLGTALGVGWNGGRRSPINRAVNRLVRYRVAERSGDALSIRAAVPLLPESQVARLPDFLQELHTETVRLLARSE